MQETEKEDLTNKKRFLELCSQIRREGIDKLLNWLENSDFYICPASTRFHGNYPGGLLEHSLNVYDELVRLMKAFPEVTAPPESVLIASLFHDLCKVNMYKEEKRNRKNEEGQWESYTAYTISEKFAYGGHGSKSVFLIQNFMKLTTEEAVAINCHMSSWDGNTFVGQAYEQHPFAWLVHVADEAATYIDERKVEK